MRAFQKRQGRWGSHPVENTFGVQFRNDNVMQVGLFHTEQRVRLETWNDASAIVTSAGVYGENQVEWARWFKTTVGLRADGSRYDVTNEIDARNSGTATAGIVSPKGTATFGPWRSTEFYVNAGTGFHSNSALGTTIRYDSNGNPVDPVTPLVRAKGAEVGVRTVAVPHLQSTVSLWALRLGSELVYNGDIGATEPGRGANVTGSSSRTTTARSHGWSSTETYRGRGPVSPSSTRPGPTFPRPWTSWSPAGASVDNFHRTFGSLRLRYFGPRALIEDNSVRSEATTLLNPRAGIRS